MVVESDASNQSCKPEIVLGSKKLCPPNSATLCTALESFQRCGEGRGIRRRRKRCQRLQEHVDRLAARDRLRNDIQTLVRRENADIAIAELPKGAGHRANEARLLL